MEKKNINRLYLIPVIFVGLLTAMLAASPYFKNPRRVAQGGGRASTDILGLKGRRSVASAASPLSAPEPFNLKQFRAQPEQYLANVEPGRVFQTAEASGPNSVYLMAVSRLRASLRSSEQLVLAVKGAPRAPVTFTALDGGTFAENTQGSVTVSADAEGNAQATFVAGTARGDLNVLVGSPLAVGSQRFFIRVLDG